MENTKYQGFSSLVTEYMDGVSEIDVKDIKRRIKEGHEDREITRSEYDSLMSQLDGEKPDEDNDEYEYEYEDSDYEV